MNPEIPINHFFPSLSEECKEDLISNGRILRLQKNHHLVREGQRNTKLYFILKGSARTYYLKDGRDITDWIALEGDFICSINSFFQNQSSELEIEVIENSSLFEISKETYLNLTEQHSEFDKLGKQIITETMLHLQRRIVSLQFESAEQKLKNLLLTRPEILDRVSLTHIASYLGMSLETLSRIKNRSLT